jgi:hypothetical protein
MTLDNMVGRGLEKAATDRAEIQRYLAKIRRKVADCAKDAISLDSRFDIAFEALLQIALAALRANGYRATSEAGHQQLAIQLLPKSIGVDPTEIRALDEYRKKRSIGLYEADFDPSEEEVKAVSAAVSRLLDRLLGWIRGNRPDWIEEPAGPRQSSGGSVKRPARAGPPPARAGAAKPRR